MLSEELSKQYEQYHAAGMNAKKAGNHRLALSNFEQADQLALDNGDGLKRLHALTPAARALWSMRDYDGALEKLETASCIATELNLSDELGIAVSGVGRVKAVQIINEEPVELQRKALRKRACHHFSDAQRILKGDLHLYYRYANAQHGSVVSAMAADRKLASKLVVEGFWVAFRRSPEPYDQKPSCLINSRGLLQLIAAASLIPLADKTPLIAATARHRFICLSFVI